MKTEFALGPWKADNPENANGWWIIVDESGYEIGSGDGGFEKDQAVY